MHAREEDDVAPSDLYRTAAYRFGQAWLGSAASACFLFFLQIYLIILQMPTRFKNL
jgi:hypothetical protein